MAAFSNRIPGIGSSFRTGQVKGGPRLFVWGGAGTILILILSAVLSAVYTHLIGVGTQTSLLAFAPGGISEMAITAVVYYADSTFVTSVLLIRMLMILLLTPMVIKWICMKLSGKTHKPGEPVSDKRSFG